MVQWATAIIEDSKLEESDPSDYDEIVTTKEAETIDTFSSQVIHAKMKTSHRGEGINVMTQVLCVENGSLPQGLMVQNAYTELCSGSKNTTVVMTLVMPYMMTYMRHCNYLALHEDNARMQFECSLLQ